MSQDILEILYSEKLLRTAGYVRVPTVLFIEKIDIKSQMTPLPEIDLYQQSQSGPPDSFESLKTANQPYSKLALSLHEFVWIKDHSLVLIQKYVENLLPEARMQVLRKKAITVVDDLFQDPSPENIQRSTKVVGSFVYILMKDPKAYLLLSKLSSHDPYTLQHSVGTSVNCIILAKKLGIEKESELIEVGLAGLLHDIGKVKVRKEIINKNGPLDELEWEEMRQHSLAGYEIVKDDPNLTERTKRAILEHHEDRNGTGYPHGLPLAETDVFSRIVSICDIFNALTTDRTYSKARPVYEAFQFIQDKLMHKVDDEVFKSLVLVYGGKLNEEQS